MRLAVRATAVGAVLSLAVAACGSSTATPSASLSASPSEGPSATATATATATPTAALATATATPTATAKPTATPKPKPTPVRGLYLLYRKSITIAGGSRPQLWVIKADGTGNHKIADGPNLPEASPPTHDISAAWSSDGSVVHVVLYAPSTSVTTNCTPHISNIPIDGGAATTVGASLTNHDDAFMWSPSGAKIVFRHWVAQPDCVQDSIDDRTNLMVMNANGSGRTTIASNVTYDITGWTSDGTSLIGHDKTTYQPVLVNPSTGHATLIAPLSSDSSAVSPNGSGVAFVTSGQLHVVNSNGTGPVNLSAPSAVDYGPVWSPNGTKLAFQRTIGASTRVDVITLPSPTATLLRSTPSGLNGFPCWSPTGTRVAFSVNSGSIVVVNASGTGSHTLSGTSNVKLLSWQP